MQHARYIIVGGGVAGTVAAETIRTADADARVVIVSAEDHPLYSRVLLPKYVKGDLPREKLFLRSWEQYAAKKIEVLRGKKVVAVDPAAHTATLDDGAVWEYEKLLLATGGEAMLPEHLAHLPHVLRFRTIEDAEAITSEVTRLASLSKKQRRAAVIGGGFIALEFPPFFAPHGIETHLLLRGPRYWHRVLSEQGSAAIERVLEAHGVLIHRNVEVSEAVGADDGLSLTLTDGSMLAVGALGVGTGIACVPACAAPAGVAAERGILVNERLETNVADIWAAGDDAEFPDPLAGHRRLLGNWLNADQQGRLAGANMSGARRTFANVSQYATRIFDTVIAAVGDCPAEGGERIVKEDTAAGTHLELWHRNGTLVGAVMIGLTVDRNRIIAAIKDKTSVEEFLS